MTDRRATWRIGLWLTCMLLSAGWILIQAELRTDPSALMPRALGQRQQLLLEQLQGAMASRLILIGIEQGSPEQRAAASRALAAALRSVDFFRRVDNGDSGVDPLLAVLLYDYRYLLRDLDAEAFSARGLRQALEQRLQELRSPLSPIVARLLPGDPTGEMLRLQARLADGMSHRAPDRSDGVWTAEEGRMVVLLAETRARGLDSDASRQAVAAIQHAFLPLAEQGLRLTLAGPPVMAQAAENRIRGESTWLSLLAMLLVALLVKLGYRSWLPLLYAAMPVLTALVTGALALILIYGDIHGITLALGIVLLGICVDYPLHFFSHRRHGSPQVFAVLRLGALTTVLGFTPLLFSGFVALEQLGLLVGIGVLSAWLTTRYLLPLLPGLDGVAPRGLPGGDLTVPLRGRPAGGVAVGLLGLAGLWLSLGSYALWEDDIAALSPVSRADLELDQRLRSALGAPEVGKLLLLRGPDSETLLQRAEALAPELQRLIDGGEIVGADLLPRLLPSRARQAERQARLPQPEAVRLALAEAQTTLPFKADLFAPFLGELEAARTRAPLTPTLLAQTSLAPLVEALLSTSGEGWTLAIPLSGVRDSPALAAHFAGRSQEGVDYLDLRVETGAVVAEFRDRALGLLALGAGVIALILVLALRSVKRALRVLFPVAAALVLVPAVLTLLGERLSLFHLISLVLVLGIGLDYSLFAVQATADAQERAATLHALRLCMASTVVVFGLLSLSKIAVLHAMGFTVAIGVLAAYGLSLLAVAGNLKEERA